MIFGFLYDIATHLLAFGMIPKLLLDWKKYRKTMSARLGIGFPRIQKGEKKLVWIHAVSMGEVKAVALLIKKLKDLPNPPSVLLSTVTATGHAEAKKSAADWHVYLPFDLRYIIRPIVKRVRPDLVVLAETDFWYHFQSAAKTCGAELVVVNGKISERSFLSFRKVPIVARHLLGLIDHYYVQGSLYETRFREIGIPANKITITGNMKLDANEEILQKLSKEELGSVDQYVITLGSTHAPEEKLWIHALKQIWQKHPFVKVMIAPRHPERFAAVGKLLKEAHLPYQLWSQGGTLHTCNVLLIDAMGILKTCYGLSDLAFVGGSFLSSVGGHNILEPSFFGKPVLFGPHMHSQPDLLDLVRFYKAGLQIKPEEIVKTVNQCIENPAFASHLGENGLKLITESKGALNNTFQCLLEKIGS